MRHAKRLAEHVVLCKELPLCTDKHIAPCAHRSVGEEDARPDEDVSRLEQRIAEAAERQDVAQKQFDRLCSICIAAQQACPLCADTNPLRLSHLLLHCRPVWLLLCGGTQRGF